MATKCKAERGKNMKELKEVDWKRKYRMEMGSENLVLKRKGWGFRLLYDVYLRYEDGVYELIGTCHVMQNQNDEFVVQELVSKSPQLKKRLEDIQLLVQRCL